MEDPAAPLLSTLYRRRLGTLRGFGRAVFFFADFFAVLDFFAGADLRFAGGAVFRFAAGAAAAAVFLEWTANTTPCGSITCVIQSPPGTSIGPFKTFPPRRGTISATFFESGTSAYGSQCGGAGIVAGLLNMPPSVFPFHPNIWYRLPGPISIDSVFSQPNNF